MAHQILPATNNHPPAPPKTNYKCQPTGLLHEKRVLHLSRKESDVPNDSEEDSSSEDSSGSDSGSSSSGSNGSESDSKKTSGDKRDSSHKTGSPGRAGRNNEINSSGREKEKSGENGSDHGRDNDGYKHRNSRDKTDERTKVKDAEGDISSDGEQITRSGPRSTIVQKSSVTRKDSETKERSEDSGKRTLFKEPEKRDRERRDDDEESQRRRRTRSRSPRNRESERGKDYRGRDDKPRRPDNRDDKGRQRDRDDDSRKHENRRREERQDNTIDQGEIERWMIKEEIGMKGIKKNAQDETENQVARGKLGMKDTRTMTDQDETGMESLGDEAGMRGGEMTGEGREKPHAHDPMIGTGDMRETET
ncbi:hypothetical protein C0Q70_04384 [Pomacea canaliculata]|uniref:Uncharacterized protein n=1 Tax=Pomacea canaliculata TaxID=400727 RepID=A0A2T7PVD0_POMCA|nr:hypothetical protein C0Q70_04384 [Pomacea canaliculata]